MTELSETQIQNKAVCTRCNTDYSNNILEKMCMGKTSVCQMCRAELSGKYADGQDSALADLIIAARDLRQASKDYDDSNDCGEMYYAERISGPVDLLIDALDNYEGGGKR